ncbi:MAG: flippase-like domain-containing protein, partial [Lachnospiraceae bacterium]|nr:flippase-like domain-containing protein [Lachnospiraceae bacterium]
MNIGVLVWTGISELNRKNSGATSLEDVEIRWVFFLLATLCFLITVSAEGGKYFSLIRQLTEKKDWSTSLKVTIYGRYYDNMTPSGAGGQPFQILYLKRRGLPDGASLAIPVYAFLLQQLSFVIVAIFFFLFFGHLFRVPALKVTAYVGLGFYSLMPILIILSALFPKTMGKIIMRFLRGLAAIRLLKDPETKGAKILQQLQEYSRAINYINRHRSLTLEMFLLSVLYHMGRASLPFFILQAFGGQVDWLVVTVSTFFIYAAITIIPTPGGAGAAEASFYLVFADLPDSGLVFWAMLLW